MIKAKHTLTDLITIAIIITYN